MFIYSLLFLFKQFIANKNCHDEFKIYLDRCTKYYIFIHFKLNKNKYFFYETF